jgi:lysophospholipase L1-like esterase
MVRKRLFTILILVSVCAFQVHAQTSAILVDFGSNPSAAPWINFSNPTTGVIHNVPNSFGGSTDLSLEVFDAFNGINTNGTQNPDPSLEMPNTASGDSFFGNTATWSGRIEPTGGIRLSNLDSEKEYTLTIFASRDATDNRETQYICTGATQDTSFLNVAGNKNAVVTFSIYPTAGGAIEIVASRGPNNNNSYGFYYLGALIIEYQSDYIPDPELHLVRPNGGEYWQVGKTAKIVWKSTIQSQSILDYSIDNGVSWTTIGTVPAHQRSYDWVIPDTPSEQCLVRVASDTLLDKSDNHFEITSETGSCSVVVLGSSTAEGTGASTPDSAWVNRFRNAVCLDDTRYKVVNLAMGGYTTYHLLPTGSTSGTHVGIAVDKTRNITKALSLNPSGIIINLPSNDAANNFPVKDQLDNFKAMVSEAAAQEVPVWICTTQPRNFANSSQIQIQKDVRDSIFVIYGGYALDFWNGLAKPNGYILDAFNSGDGVHLNDQGHGLLYQRVKEKVEWDSICSGITSVQKKFSQPSEIQVNLYPNPFNLSTKLEFNVPAPGLVEIKIFNILGQNIKTLVNRDYNIGSHKVIWDGTDNYNRIVNSSTYFIRIKAGDYLEIKKALIIK